MKKEHPETNWLDRHSRALMLLSEIAFEIACLAENFRMTGNESMYKSLTLLSEDIERAVKTMRDAVGESISEAIARSDEHSRAILEAALAGMFLERKEDGIS